MDNVTLRIGFFGMGSMGGALLRALAASPDGLALRASNFDAARREALAAELAVQVSDAADLEAQVDLARWSDILFVAVKPGGVLPLLAAVRPALRPETLVVSIAAGISLAALEDALGETQPCARVMPNLGARVGASATTYCLNPACTAPLEALLTPVLARFGSALRLPEPQMNLATAVAGSGPAYLLLAAEALIDAAVAEGMPRKHALALVQALFEGTGKLMAQDGSEPAALRWQVTSPGGTTAAGVAHLEAAQVRAALAGAVRAARRRADELA